MSYENAPATKLLATHCCACGRPLVDSESVEIGMGPDCRQKYGFNDSIPSDARQQANRLVHQIAAQPDAPEMAEMINQVAQLGLVRLAAKLADRVAVVRIVEQDGRLVVHTPYDEQVVAAMRAIPGRRWEPTMKANTFPGSSRPALWTMLKRFYTGRLAMGPKGLFRIGQEARQASLPLAPPVPADDEQIRQEAEIYGVSEEEVRSWKKNMQAGRCPDGCCP